MSSTIAAGRSGAPAPGPAAPSRATATSKPAPCRWSVSRSIECASSSTSRTVGPAVAAPSRRRRSAAPARAPAASDAGWRTGSVKVKVLPTPELALHPDAPAVQLHEPLRQRQAQPGPLLLLARPRPPCWNSSKIRAWSSGAMPMPGVADRDLDLVAQPPRLDLDPAAVGRELDGVGEQVEDDLLDLALVGLDQRRRPARISRLSSMPCGRPARGPSSGRCRAPPASENGAELQLHPAGLDLGQVEDVVDQREQVPPGVRMSCRYSLLLARSARRTSARSAPRRSR